MDSLILPDVNVLLAFANDGHPQHEDVQRWHTKQGRPEMLLCRLTQIGLLRLLTNRSALGVHVQTNAEAWRTFKHLESLGDVRLVREPLRLEDAFERESSMGQAAPKWWTDGYLSAFAQQGGYRLVTFDAVLARRTPASILLRARSS